MFFAKQNEYREYQLENPDEFLKQKNSTIFVVKSKWVITKNENKQHFDGVYNQMI